MSVFNIPTTRRDATIEEYHGTQVADPYRWLEDSHAPEVQAWGEAQSEAAEEFLAAIPQRAAIKNRLTELMDYPKYGVPQQEGASYYFTKNSGLQNQGVLYGLEKLDGPASVVLDPNTLSSDGTIALILQSFSEDGKLLAYSTAVSGSDWQEIRIRDIESGIDYEEVIRWCKFTNAAWRHDNQGFYYSRYPNPEGIPEEEQMVDMKVYWHTLGTLQEEDELIYERPDAKELGFDSFVTDDGQYLGITVFDGTASKNRFYYREIGSDGDFVRLLEEADAKYAFVGNDGPIFYFNTNLDAPKGRIIAIDIRSPQREHWRELVPEHDDVIDFALIVNHQFVIVYMHDAHHQVKLYKIDGSYERDVELPTAGSIVEISGKPKGSELFINFTSFLHPGTIYRYDFGSVVLAPLHPREITFDPDDYMTEQVFYASKDGTRVPMFLSYKKGLVRNGENATLLYGYGGFDISLTPNFSPAMLLWMELGGVYAVANLRGGGEYGEQWHTAGMLEKKQNVFDDFIAAAEWLIANGYTETPRLATYGRSNGGLLVAACLVQRPDLYGAVAVGVPVIDMLRYHKFTVGRYWIPEYGDAEHDAEQFAFLYEYSPLHNVREGVGYPPTLILTADTDDRVVPMHSKKFTATLQAANGGENPILLRLEMKAGHGLGKPTAKVIEESTDLLAFLVKTTM